MLALNLRQHTFWRLRWRIERINRLPCPVFLNLAKLMSVILRGRLLSKFRPNIIKLSKISRRRSEKRKEKEIQRLEEEVKKQYISHFSIDRQGNVTKDDTFDSSQFEVKSDEIKQPDLDSQVANMVNSVVASHVNNKLEFIGQNMHDIFDDRFSQIEIHLGMKSIGNDASTSNTDLHLIPIRQWVVRLVAKFQLIILL